MANESKPPRKKPSDTGRTGTADRGARTLAIGALLPGIAGETLGRRGFAEGTIFRQWREIVGADIAADCVPEKLAFAAGRRSDGTLHVVAAGPAALELQHRNAQIVDRVNAYLGYAAIARLRIRQGRLPVRRRYADAEPDCESAGAFDEPALARIGDPALKEALARFGHAVRRSATRRKPGANRR